MIKYLHEQSNQKKMETVKNKKEQHVKLVDGEFTPLQASDIVSSLIEQKINFHKVENLQYWEKDHKNDQKPFIKRVKELEDAEKEAKSFILNKEFKGKKIKIKGNLTISIEE